MTDIFGLPVDHFIVLNLKAVAVVIVVGVVSVAVFGVLIFVVV